MKKIAIIGSTGSIGTQALDIIRQFPDNFEVVAITTNSNLELLKEQIKEFKPKIVAITNHKSYKTFLNSPNSKNLVVTNNLEDILEETKIDQLITAVVGSIGLKTTLKAIDKGIDIALANKETLVMAGEIVMQKAQEKGVNIFPIDSEHSAIWQALQGNKHEEVKRIWLTCSGGPFFGKARDFLEGVELKDALKHPTWNMGGKITIDSSTLMNKGLEVIEAAYLFNLEPEQIKVVIHPQSIIHSMVEYNDTSIMAQLGLPSMKVPIQYSLFYPKRPKNNLETLDFYKLKELTFGEPDLKTFSPLKLAYQAVTKKGIYPTVLNAANETLVDLFLKEKIEYIQIFEILEKVMKEVKNIPNPSLDQIFEADKNTRQKVKNML